MKFALAACLATAAAATTSDPAAAAHTTAALNTALPGDRNVLKSAYHTSDPWFTWPTATDCHTWDTSAIGKGKITATSLAKYASNPAALEALWNGATKDLETELAKGQCKDQADITKLATDK